jgi:hypothetical protein
MGTVPAETSGPPAYPARVDSPVSRVSVTHPNPARLGGFEGVLVRKSLIINAIVFKVFTTEPVRLKVLET